MFVLLFLHILLSLPLIAAKDEMLTALAVRSVRGNCPEAGTLTSQLSS